MLGMWVLTVFTETQSSPATGRERFVGRVAQHLEFGGAERFRRVLMPPPMT